MAKNSEFETWFEAQFGKPIFSAKRLSAALKKQKSLSNELYSLEKKINQHGDYMDFKRSALYAWNAARKLKNG